jgi:hypothetical protein
MLNFPIFGQKERKRNTRDRRYQRPLRSSPQLLSFIPEGREAPGGETSATLQCNITVLFDSVVLFSNF